MVHATLPLGMGFLLFSALSSALAVESDILYGPGEAIGSIPGDVITESSGLAKGRANENLFWTHNDSGGGPIIYAFETSGKVIASVTLNGVKGSDWEDMASFSYEKTNYLLIGDVGDNYKRRSGYKIHILREPAIPGNDNPVEMSVDVEQTINFTYEDGPHNCESVAMDAKDGVIYLVTKEPKTSRFLGAVYEIPWSKTMSLNVVARKVTNLDIPTATAMDISPDGLRAMVLTYQNAYEYVRSEGESWATAYGRAPREIPMPRRDQGEAICFGLDGMTLFLTSETKNKLPQPFWSVAATLVDSTPPVAPVCATSVLVTSEIPTLSGTAEANSTITILNGVTVVGTAVADSLGAWSATLSVPLMAGVTPLTVTATDPSNNTSPATTVEVVYNVDDTPPVAPVMASEVMITPAAPILSGTAEAGTIITAMREGAEVGTVTVGMDGTWHLTIVPMLPAGSASVLWLTATDAAGNVSARTSVTVTVGGDTSPVGGDTSPVGGDTSPVGGDTSPVGGDTSPVGGDTSPVGGAGSGGGAVGGNVAGGGDSGGGCGVGGGLGVIVAGMMLIASRRGTSPRCQNVSDTR